MTVASVGSVDTFEPGATLMGGKYRLEKLLVAHGGVAVWDAVDLHSGRSVQLSVFEQSSAMLDHGRLDRGVFAVFDVPPRSPARLELALVSEEDAFFNEPPPPELFVVPTSRSARVWLWAAPALFACALAGLAALYVTRVRTPDNTSEVTITEATIPAPTVSTPTISIPPPPPPEVPSVEVAHRAPPRASPVRPAPRRVTPAPVVKRAPHPQAPPHPPPIATASDPLTL